MWLVHKFNTSSSFTASIHKRHHHKPNNNNSSTALASIVSYIMNKLPIGSLTESTKSKNISRVTICRQAVQVKSNPQN